MTCDGLNMVDKAVEAKVTGKPLGIMDSLIRATYAGLEKVFTMVQDAYNDVQQNKYPDFTGDVPFPPAPSPPSSKSADAPSWFMLSWKTVEDGLNLLATKNAKLAEFLPPIEAFGDELVKDLQQYFPSSSNIPDLHAFPSLPPSRLSVLPGT